MLLMVERSFRNRICHDIHQYVETNNKYMKDCDKNKESAYSIGMPVICMNVVHP